MKISKMHMVTSLKKNALLFILHAENWNTDIVEYLAFEYRSC